MESNLDWLQAWRLEMERERPGNRPIFEIASLSTTGWVVTADLRDFDWDASLLHVPLKRVTEDDRWVETATEGPVLKVYCGAMGLDAALWIVRNFIAERGTS